MKTKLLYDRLLDAARQQRPSDAVPHAFERRIMARIAQGSGTDTWAAWAAVLWRAALPCLAIMLLTSALALVINLHPAPQESVAQQLEATVLADVEDLEDLW